MSLVAQNILAAFTLFQRPLTYIRENVQYTIRGCVNEPTGDQALIGDIEQSPSIVTLAVNDLKALNLYPPQKYDRVLYHGHSHAVEDFRINYDGETAVLARLRCVG